MRTWMQCERKCEMGKVTWTVYATANKTANVELLLLFCFDKNRRSCGLSYEDVQWIAVAGV